MTQTSTDCDIIMKANHKQFDILDILSMNAYRSICKQKRINFHLDGENITFKIF